MIKLLSYPTFIFKQLRWQWSTNTLYSSKNVELKISQCAPITAASSQTVANKTKSLICRLTRKSYFDHLQTATMNCNDCGKWHFHRSLTATTICFVLKPSESAFSWPTIWPVKWSIIWPVIYLVYYFIIYYW